MMSPYESPSVRTDSGGGGEESQGNPNGGAQECESREQELTGKEIARKIAKYSGSGVGYIKAFIL